MESQMSYRRLGTAGLKVSTFSLGGWTTFGGSVNDDSVIHDIIHTAFDAGVNFFDIADMYAKGEAEIRMGKVLSDFPRHHLVISTKAFWPMSENINDRGLSRKHLMESVERSLARIGTDYLDMFFCHRFDPETPVEETLRAMDDLVHQGKVLYWGTSEWTGSQIHDACRLAKEQNLYAPTVEQPQLSLLEQRKYLDDVQPAAAEHGLGIVVWSPLGSGLLTGKYDEGIPEGSRLSQIDWLKDMVYQEQTVEKVRKMKGIADRLGTTRTKLALAWASRCPGVSSVILGATSTDQLTENLDALNVEIDESTSRELDEIFAP